MNNHRKLFLVLSAFLTMSGVLFGVHAYAQDIRPGCDSQYMDALEAKAWLGGQRRISQNKNFILKPDSVLEYSCFNQFIGHVASNDARRFSENFPEYPNWGPITGIGEESLDFALFEVVTLPVLQYLTSFGHPFLAGRTADAGGAPPAYGEYDCNAMQFVWGLARCWSFTENEDIDGFYDFPWYAANDPRQFPPEHECLPPTDQINAAMIEPYRGEGQDGVHGDEWESFVLQTENAGFTDVEPYEEDPMLLHLNMVPGPAGPPINCGLSPIVPTGVWIEIPGQSDFQEHVCAMPGCSYDGNACAP